MVRKVLNYSRQSISNKDIESVIKVLKSDFLTTGPMIERFEKNFSKYTSAKYSIACSSGTSALLLSYLSLGCDKESIVFVPNITFTATASAAKFLGAKIILVDCDEESGLILSKSLENKIKILSSSQKKMFCTVVHLNGQCCDLEEISKICRKYKVHLIEDACHALGAKFIDSKKRRYIIGDCNFSDFSTFSFHPVKNITMGEGGMINTNSKELFEKVILLRNHGIFKRLEEKTQLDSKWRDPWYYEVQDVSLNFRTSDINCALGLSQLKRIDTLKKKREKIYQRYIEAFDSNKPYIQVVKKNDNSIPAWHLCVLKIDFNYFKITRNQLMNLLKNMKINTQVHYIPLSRQPVYSEKSKNSDLKFSLKYYEKILSIPMYPDMSIKDVDYVIRSLKKIFKLVR